MQAAEYRGPRREPRGGGGREPFRRGRGGERRQRRARRPRTPAPSSARRRDALGSRRATGVSSPRWRMRTGPSSDARRADSRRRMWIALAINVGAARRRGRRRDRHRLAGAARRRRPRALRRRRDRARPVRGDDGRARRGGSRRTFGFQRGEVLAALVNGVALVAIAVLIVIAAIGRSRTRPTSRAPAVLVLGVVGLAGNLAATWVLARGERERHQPRGRPAPLVRRRARLDRRHRLRDRDPGHRLAAGRPDREPR